MSDNLKAGENKERNVLIVKSDAMIVERMIYDTSVEIVDKIFETEPQGHIMGYAFDVKEVTFLSSTEVPEGKAKAFSVKASCSLVIFATEEDMKNNTPSVLAEISGRYVTVFINDANEALRAVFTDLIHTASGHVQSNGLPYYPSVQVLKRIEIENVDEFFPAVENKEDDKNDQVPKLAQVH